MKYTIKDFNQQFKTDADCLAYIYKTRFPEGVSCTCGHKDCFHPLKERPVYCCQWCGHQISPMAGTIFHKSPTSLKSWFFAMFLMAASKNGVSAKELERQLGVTYKCAWRMAHQIRKLMKEDDDTLKGIVEADETYIGGKRKGMGGGYKKNKTAVFGMVERKGRVKSQVVERVTGKVLGNALKQNVDPSANLMTDEFRSYRKVGHSFNSHEVVKHGLEEYVRGNVHTNSIEGFWSQLKRSIHGTHHWVSRKWLQNYVNEFAYRYNRRNSEISMFSHLASAVGEMHA